MLGIGFSEILIILLIALIVVGPEKIPGIAKVLGKTFREFNRAVRDVKGTVREATETATDAVKGVEDEIKGTFKDITPKGIGGDLTGKFFGGDDKDGDAKAPSSERESGEGGDGKRGNTTEGS